MSSYAKRSARRRLAADRARETVFLADLSAQTQPSIILPGGIPVVLDRSLGPGKWLLAHQSPGQDVGQRRQLVGIDWGAEDQTVVTQYGTSPHAHLFAAYQAREQERQNILDHHALLRSTNLDDHRRLYENVRPGPLLTSINDTTPADIEPVTRQMFADMIHRMPDEYRDWPRYPVLEMLHSAEQVDAYMRQVAQVRDLAPPAVSCVLCLAGAPSHPDSCRCNCHGGQVVQAPHRYPDRVTAALAWTDDRVTAAPTEEPQPSRRVWAVLRDMEDA